MKIEKQTRDVVVIELTPHEAEQLRIKVSTATGLLPLDSAEYKALCKFSDSLAKAV